MPQTEGPDAFPIEPLRRDAVRLPASTEQGVLLADVLTSARATRWASLGPRQAFAPAPPPSRQGGGRTGANARIGGHLDPEEFVGIETCKPHRIENLPPSTSLPKRRLLGKLGVGDRLDVGRSRPRRSPWPYSQAPGCEAPTRKTRHGSAESPSWRPTVDPRARRSCYPWLLTTRREISARNGKPRP